MDDTDWRLQRRQWEYLTGITLVRRRWHQSRPDWDHDHCAFCWDEFNDDDREGILREGWTDPDDEYC
jgi:hypothetical protein